MNSRVIIFLFLALISENVFSQEDISDSMWVKEYMQLSKSLSEANDRIKLLQEHASIKEDSL